MAVSHNFNACIFMASKEIAIQLEKVQNSGVIQESQSPWARPVVSVKTRWLSPLLCELLRERNFNYTKTDVAISTILV